MSWLDDLAKIMPPPDNPQDIEGINWKDIERGLGIPIPEDYKEFLSVYGTGCIGDFLWVLNPLSQNSSLNLLDTIKHDQKSYEYLKQQHVDQFNRPLIPETGSFLTWAITDNGDSISWEIKGPPESWLVGIHNVSHNDEVNFALPFADFLLEFVNRKLVSNILPVEYLDEEMKFTQA